MSSTCPNIAQSGSAAFISGLAPRQSASSIEKRLAERELRARARFVNKRIESHRRRLSRESLLLKLKRIA
ncbi:hypothetical protein WCLP8_5020002 [uncultured Gammaproteobacteria bacterium]